MWSKIEGHLSTKGMVRWSDREEVGWNNIFHNPPSPGSSGKILYAEVHGAQQTPDVKHWLHKCKTTLINVPGGTTSTVQTPDVSITLKVLNFTGT